MDYFALLGLLIFFASLVGFSMVLARKTKRRVTSAIVATLAASLLIQAIAYAHLGYFDPFYQIAFVTSVVIGFPMSLLVVSLALRKLTGQVQV
jgi:multisubunit Na+/H+ antiporter MnhC subunit